MGKERLAALTDGVIAVIITIMVLELKSPAGAAWSDLASQWPVFVAYVLSFIYVAIYWNSHHHLFALVETVSGRVMWANFNLLFWLSLIPFATAWVGEHADAVAPTALYGVSLLLPALAWLGLQAALLAEHDANSILRRLVGGSRAARFSPLLYLSGVGLSFVAPWAGDLVYAGVALVWFRPAPSIERHLRNQPGRD